MSSAPFSVVWVADCLFRPASEDPLADLGEVLGLDGDTSELLSQLGGTPVEFLRPWGDHLEAAWAGIVVDDPGLAASLEQARRRRGTLVLSLSDVQHARFTRTAEYDSLSYPARLLLEAPDPVREFTKIVALFGQRGAAADVRDLPPADRP